jgi:formylmethanofuran dehydrogenase subunit B
MSTKPNPLPADSNLAFVCDVACLGCSCLCDDIQLIVAEDQIVEARHACDVGRAWFAEPCDMTLDCSIESKRASYAEAIEHAAGILRRAKYPLVYGMARLDTMAQRTTLAIADAIGACVDSAATQFHAAHSRAIQTAGEVTCTYGEVAARSNLVIYWGADPAVTHPRHAERYTLRPDGAFLQGGRTARYCVVVNSHPSATDRWADEVLRTSPDSDLDASWILRAVLRNVAVDADDVFMRTGVQLQAWRQLAERMTSSQYGALFYGEGIASSPIGHLVAESLIRLAMELNDRTRFVSMPLVDEPNVSGADEVMTWTTGFPNSVDLSHGYPRHFYDEFSAAQVLSRREADAALFVEAHSLQEQSPAARQHGRSIPRVIISCERSPLADGPAAVFIPVARLGVESGGTVYRGDGVPLPLRPAFNPKLHTTQQVLQDLRTAIEHFTV